MADVLQSLGDKFMVDNAEYVTASHAVGGGGGQTKRCGKYKSNKSRQLRRDWNVSLNILNGLAHSC